MDFIVLFSFLFGIGSSCMMGWATYAINNHKGYTNNGFWWGFWLGLIGLIVVCCKENISERVYYTSAPSYNQLPPTTYSNPNYNPVPYNPQGYAPGYSTPNPGSNGWQCSCGRFHPPYESSCVCGQTKHTVAAARAEAKKKAELAAAEAEAQKQAAKAAETESDKIAILKQYKELMDNGVLTPEEFEAKKKQLLGL